MQFEVYLLLSFLIALSGAQVLEDVDSPSTIIEELVLDKINNWFETPEEHANYLSNITKYPV